MINLGNEDNMIRLSRAVMLFAFVLLALGACGRKTELEKGAPLEIERGADGKPLPYRPFILDPLLK